jgi:hypothetical protein
MATWPPIIDDDGSGTTGTPTDYALFQQVKAYIDGLTNGGVAPVSAAFQLTDGSGAGLALTYSTGWFIRNGRLVFLQAQVVYPSTASGAAAVLAGLPVAASAFAVGGGFYQGFGAAPVRLFTTASSAAIQILNGTTGAPMTNAGMTGANLTIHGTYLVD